MRQCEVRVAVEEAKRFIGKAKELLGEADNYYYGKKSSATKRASMDLTRALADMRKS